LVETPDEVAIKGKDQKRTRFDDDNKTLKLKTRCKSYDPHAFGAPRRKAVM
jgi:hypothetical protein